MFESDQRGDLFFSTLFLALNEEKSPLRRLLYVRNVSNFSVTPRSIQERKKIQFSLDPDHLQLNLADSVGVGRDRASNCNEEELSKQTPRGASTLAIERKLFVN